MRSSHPRATTKAFKFRLPPKASSFLIDGGAMVCSDGAGSRARWRRTALGQPATSDREQRRCAPAAQHPRHYCRQIISKLRPGNVAHVDSRELYRCDRTTAEVSALRRRRCLANVRVAPEAALGRLEIQLSALPRAPRKQTQLGNRGMSEKWPISEVATRAIPRGDRLRFFRPSGCDRPNWLTWSPDHLARPVDLRMAPSPGGRHVDKHSSGRKKKSRRVPGGSSRLAVSGQPQSSVFCAAVTAAS